MGFRPLAPKASSLTSGGLDSSDTVLSGLSISTYSGEEGVEIRTYAKSVVSDFFSDILVERKRVSYIARLMRWLREVPTPVAQALLDVTGRVAEKKTGVPELPFTLLRSVRLGLSQSSIGLTRQNAARYNGQTRSNNALVYNAQLILAQRQKEQIKHDTIT